MGIHGKQIITIIMVLYKTPLQLQLELIVQHPILWQKKALTTCKSVQPCMKAAFSKVLEVRTSENHLLQASPEDGAVRLIGGQLHSQRLAPHGARVWESDAAAGAGPKAGRLPTQVFPACPGRTWEGWWSDWRIWR